MKGSELKRRRAERERPAPIVGIEAAHDRMSDALARRDDMFSQLLARAVRDGRHGAVLMTTSGLTSDEHEELAHLTPAAHENFGAELAATIARLRDLLTAGDPFFILAAVQDLNLFVPWGEYYEPTHEGLETRLELVAGLLAMQPVAVTPDRPAAETVQAILDEIGYRNYLRVHAHDDAAFFYPLGEGWQDSGDLELVARDATWVTVRGKEIAIPRRDELRRLGIEPSEPDRMRTFEVCRYVAAIERDLVLATPDERRAHVPADLAEILVLDNWHHPDTVTGQVASDTAAFRSIAEVLATGDITAYEGTIPTW
jgi:hypothetical protein